jgi:hypothetical protein
VRMREDMNDLGVVYFVVSLLARHPRGVCDGTGPAARGEARDDKHAPWPERELRSGHATSGHR